MSAIVPYVGLNEVKDEWKECLKALVAELLGTMFLVLLACGACMQHAGALDVVRIALAFGLTVATMAQSIGHVSGCHINPGVTAGLIVGRKIGIVKGLLYIVAQCVGAIVGAGLLRAVTETSSGIGEVGLRPGLSAGAGFAVEFFITFALVLVVYAAAADEDNAASVKGSAPLAIGLAIAIGHLFAVPQTGAGMNPARSLGTALISTKDGALDNHWIYWIGPLLGGVAAGLVYQMLFKAPKSITVNVTPQGDYKLTEVQDKP